jgi:hypothetical protein
MRNAASGLVCVTPALRTNTISMYNDVSQTENGGNEKIYVLKLILRIQHRWMPTKKKNIYSSQLMYLTDSNNNIKMLTKRCKRGNDSLICSGAERHVRKTAGTDHFDQS